MMMIKDVSVIELYETFVLVFEGSVLVLLPLPWFKKITATIKYKKRRP